MRFNDVLLLVTYVSIIRGNKKVNLLIHELLG